MNEIAKIVLLSLVSILPGILFILMSKPLILGKIPPNNIFGVRIPPSFESEAAWIQINAFGGKTLRLLGFALVMLFFGCYAISFVNSVDFHSLVLFEAAALVGGVLLMCLVTCAYGYGYRAAERSKKQRD